MKSRQLPRGGAPSRLKIAAALSVTLVVGLAVLVSLGSASTGRTASAADIQYGGGWRITWTADEGTVALDVNSTGVIAGYTGAPSQNAAIWVDGTLVSLTAPANHTSVAAAINDAGQTAGSVTAPLSPNQAALWSPDGKTLTLLPEPPGVTFSSAHDLNEAGEVVGIAGGYHGFVWDTQDGMTLLPDLEPGVFSSAEGVNDDGLIVGYSGSSAVVWENGEVAALPMLEGATFASAADVNEADEIVGFMRIGSSPGVGHAVLWERDEFARSGVSASEYQYEEPWKVVDLGSLGPFTGAQSINESGQITGAGGDASLRLDALAWQNGTTTVLPLLPDSQNGWGSAINDQEQIVGTSSRGSGPTFVSTAVMWEKVTDPADLLVLLSEKVADLGAGSSLAATVAQAQAALDRGDTRAVCGLLAALIKQVEAQSGKKLTPITATDLIADATEIRDALGC